MTLRCQFEVLEWNETKQWKTEDGSQMANAQIKYQYRGDIEGQSQMEMLLMYYPDGSASFTAIEHVKGTVKGEPASFVMTHSGEHSEQGASGLCRIVRAADGSELLGLSGQYLATASTVDLALGN